MPGWSDRVNIVGGSKGYAYTPGELLIESTRVREASLMLELADSEVGEDFSEFGFVLLRGIDDIDSATRFLRGAGIRAQPNHVFFANPVSGNPVYGNPVYGNPVYGNPVYGNPVYGNPVYGNPVYGNPVYGNPVYGNPVYGNPVYGNPVYGNPVYGNPVYGNPVYGNSGCCGPSPIGVVATCPGGEHCCDSDPCTCTPPAPSASPVYPHPLFARAVYGGSVGLRYELSGIRRNNASPLYPTLATVLPANAAWDRQTVRVAVIDTGWPTDPPARPTCGTPRHGEQVDVPDIEPDKWLDPVAGHGMFIAGIVLQYAPGVSVKVVSGLSTYGDGSETTIAAKLIALIEDPLPPHIINLSFGTYAPEEPGLLANVVKRAQSKGIIVVASAGNDGTARPQFPAAFPGVISVGALGPNGPAPFSNWGEWVRASAHGVDVASSFWEFTEKETDTGAAPAKFEGWALWSGTSFSAPIVAAALALSLVRQGASKSTRRAIAEVIDHPRLLRTPCHGVIINPAPTVLSI